MTGAIQQAIILGDYSLSRLSFFFAAESVHDSSICMRQRMREKLRSSAVRMLLNKRVESSRIVPYELVQTRTTALGSCTCAQMKAGYIKHNLNARFMMMPFRMLAKIRILDHLADYLPEYCLIKIFRMVLRAKKKEFSLSSERTTFSLSFISRLGTKLRIDSPLAGHYATVFDRSNRLTVTCNFFRLLSGNFQVTYRCSTPGRTKHAALESWTKPNKSAASECT